jgi:L-ascorbate metabolism protein UlaG (beta-lactamase superfamily)
MRLTRLGHACVRLEKSEMTLVIDPGSYSAPEALRGADAVLVTHEHVDHLVPDRLRSAALDNPDLRIWTNPTVAGLLAGTQVQAVSHGDAFSIGGVFEVEVHGQWHAVVHPDIPRILNVGFLVNGLVFHPGDAFTLPERPVDTLMLPVHAPWSKIAEVIDYVRAVRPRRAFPAHDGLLNDVGLQLVDGLLGDRGPGIGAEYRRPAPAESIELS